MAGCATINKLQQFFSELFWNTSAFKKKTVCAQHFAFWFATNTHGHTKFNSRCVVKPKQRAQFVFSLLQSYSKQWPRNTPTCYTHEIYHHHIGKLSQELWPRWSESEWVQHFPSSSAACLQRLVRCWFLLSQSGSRSLDESCRPIAVGYLLSF